MNFICINKECRRELPPPSEDSGKKVTCPHCGAETETSFMTTTDDKPAPSLAASVAASKPETPIQTIESPPESQTNDQTKMLAYCQMFGLHPMVGFGMTAVDSMLFGTTAATLGAGWAISIPVAMVLVIPCVLIQKKSFGDGWGAAFGKGIMIGLLTAIPTPIPSTLTAGGGVVGIGKTMIENKSKKQLK